MEGDNFVTPNTLYVKGKQKTLELHTKSVNKTISYIVGFLITKFNL